MRIRKAAIGFLRTYRYLIQSESDFAIDQRDTLRLIPRDMDWPKFARFAADLEHIDDLDASDRYAYGEIRLMRLNFYAPFLLRRFFYGQVHG